MLSVAGILPICWRTATSITAASAVGKFDTGVRDTANEEEERSRRLRHNHAHCKESGLNIFVFMAALSSVRWF